MIAADIRAALDHPILDGDGHLIEYVPLLRDFIVEEAGESVGRRFDDLMRNVPDVSVPPEERHARRVTRKAWWGLPAENTFDRATALLPDLFYDRLDEFGIDFAMLYPTMGLHATAVRDEELRRALSRACNRYYSEVVLSHRDRVEPVATIPMVTPEEAIAELDFAVGERGLKAIVMAGVVLRPIAGAEGVPGAVWVDTVAHDSVYDYDPVWQRCVELGVAPTFHALGSGWGSRTSTSNFVFNHIGHFATAQEAACRSIVMGGVAHRFPELRFSFLEGGVAWASNLCSDLIAHYEKRNREAVQVYNPERLDRTLYVKLIEQHGAPAVVERLDRVGYSLDNLFGADGLTPDETDEFKESGLSSEGDIAELFTDRFFFGCEADDPMTAIAFHDGLPPVGRDMQPVFASDIGHFDVPDAAGVLPEAYELIERGELDADQFRRFTFENAARFFTTQNPAFFDGTSIQEGVRQLRQSA